MKTLSWELTPKLIRYIHDARRRSARYPNVKCATPDCPGEISKIPTRPSHAICTVCYHAAALELLASMALAAD